MTFERSLKKIKSKNIRTIKKYVKTVKRIIYQLFLNSSIDKIIVNLCMNAKKCISFVRV
jgi:hypothetical protein